MLPDATGRYCNSCQKSVIDFTAKSDKEIQQFISNNLNQSLCGRFKNTQVQRIVIDLPKNIFSIKMPLWMRFLVACLLIFGISIFPFETTIAGKVSTATTFYQGEPIKIDTTKKLRIVKKKKRRKLRYIHSEIIFLEPMIMGYTQTLPLPNLLDTLPDTSSQLFTKEISYAKHTEDKSTHLTTTSKSLPQKEKPGPTPYMPTEFILPSILLFRKENNSQSMD